MTTPDSQPESLSTSSSQSYAPPLEKPNEEPLNTVGVDNNYYNVNVDLIHVNRDKAVNYIIDFKMNVELKHAWLGAFGVFFTAGTALVTSSFQDRYLSSNNWKTVFVSCTIVFGWVFIFNLFKYIRKIHYSDPEYLVRKLAKQPDLSHPLIRIVTFLKTRISGSNTSA